MNIIYVGNADPERLHTALSPILTDYHPTEVVRSTTEVIRRSSKHRYLNEKCVGKQGNLIMGFRTGTVLADGDYPKMALLNELLGGSATSMLFMNVREKLSLCYYCSSFVEAIKGVLFVRAGIDNSNYQAARDEILRQISQLLPCARSREMRSSRRSRRFHWTRSTFLKACRKERIFDGDAGIYE